MSTLLRASFTAIVVVSTCVALSSCGDGPSAEVVARVRGSTITVADVQHWLPVIAQAKRQHGPAGVLAADLQGDDTLTRRTLAFLLVSTRAVGEAEEAGVHVTNAEAQAALERFRYEQVYGAAAPPPHAAELASLLAAKAESASDQLWIMKVHMLAARLERRELSLAEREIPAAVIARYYSRHKRDFIAPERRNVDVILTWQKRPADEARREIESGKSLAEVVERRNEEPDVGGLKVGLAHRAIFHPFEGYYFTARPHVLVGPLKAQLYYLFEVTGIISARQQSLAEVETAIRHMQIAGPQRRLLTDRMVARAAAWRARTSCRESYAVPQCGSRLA